MSMSLTLTRHQTFAAADLCAHPLDDDPVVRQLTSVVLNARGKAGQVEVTEPQRAQMLRELVEHLTGCADGCLLDEAAAEILIKLIPSPGPDRHSSNIEALPGELYRYSIGTPPDLVVRVENAFRLEESQWAKVTILCGGSSHSVITSTTTMRSRELRPLTT